MYLDGSLEQADYARKKDELLHEKTGIRERIRRIDREGSVWLEPIEAFLNDAILSETTAFSGTEQELRDFHRRIGSNLSMIEPIRLGSAAGRRARASKERAHRQAPADAEAMADRQESPATSSRRGGFAARDSIEHDSDYPSPPMRKAGPSSAEDSAASGKSLSPDAESHDSASRKMTVKKSSSRWADRPVPILEVEFPEPWSIIAAANLADATGACCAGNPADGGKNPKWSGRLDLNQRLPAPKAGALPDCATPRNKLLKFQIPIPTTPPGACRDYQAVLRPANP